MMVAVLLLLPVLCPPSTVSAARGAVPSAAAAIVAVPRIPASEFSPSRFYSSSETKAETPVVVEGVLGVDECESMCDDFLDLAGSIPIEIQRRRWMRGSDDSSSSSSAVTTMRTDVYECTVRGALDLAMRSEHDDSVFAFCEGLLDEVEGLVSDDGSASERMGRILDAIDGAKEGLFSSDRCGDGGGDSGGDWFEHFPGGARPADCVVMAGEGATSTLHRDPFEWLGTSLCLEGSKVWRLLPPPSYYPPAADGADDGDGATGMEELDEALGSYRLASTAWDDDGGGDESIPLSAGWQSDKSLFRNRDASVPSAKDLSDMEDGARIAALEEFASDPDALRPDFGDVTKPPKGVDRDGGARRFWSFRGRPYWTAVQRTGDLLLVPAHWWHQTYALEPSLSIASQRCDSRRDAARVVGHVLDNTGTLASAPDVLRKEDYSDLCCCCRSRGVDRSSPRDVVYALFEHVVRFGHHGATAATAGEGGRGR